MTSSDPDGEPTTTAVEADPEAATPAPPPPALRKRRPFWRELPVLIVIAFVVALLIKTFVLQAFFIPSASMEPTLQIGDRVLVEKVSYHFGGPSRGDVVVFERDLPTPPKDQPFWTDIVDGVRGLFGFPTGNAQDFIKRVIALGGDTVEGRDGHVFVNGEELSEPYLPPGVLTSTFGPVHVPDGQMFVMGDNRGNSDDSRSFGPVDEDAIVGHAFVLVWPPKDFDTL